MNRTLSFFAFGAFVGDAFAGCEEEEEEEEEDKRREAEAAEDTITGRSKVLVLATV